MPVSVSEKTRLKQYMNAVPPTLDLPFQPFDWLDFASGKKIHGQDFIQFIMLLAGGMSAVHHQKVLSVVGKCISILRDPGAVGGSGKKSKWERKKFGQRKVKNMKKSPWGQGFN